MTKPVGLSEQPRVVTLDVECPKCWARPGEKCRWPDGRKARGRGAPHAARAKVAYRAADVYNRWYNPHGRIGRSGASEPKPDPAPGSVSASGQPIPGGRNER